MTLAHLLSKSAVRFSDRVALVTDSARLTYRELDVAATRVARAIVRRGVAPGDVVSIFSENRWEWIVTYHAALRAGAVINPLNAALASAEVDHATRDCGSRLLFSSSTALASLNTEHLTHLAVVDFDNGGSFEPFSTMLTDLTQALPEPAGGTQLCSIAYTSGTTGFPKGAMQTQRSIELNFALTAAMHGRTSNDVVVTALPAAHVYGNVAINSTLLTGGRVCLMSRFDPVAALSLIEREGATMFEGVPAVYAMMIANMEAGRADGRLATMTRSTVGGQTMPVATMQAWESLSGAPLIELWGMTELSGLGATHPHTLAPVHGSIGLALPGTELRIVDLADADRRAAVGEPGELCVRGPLVMSGYFGNPAATTDAIHDGWLRTGDVAVMNDSGYAFVVDRVKDVILSGGYNVYPAEVERVLAAHPSVQQVAVVGSADAIYGEVPHAFIVARPGHNVDMESLLDTARPMLARYKLPRRLTLVDALPTTSSGKVLRRALRDARDQP